MGQTRFKRPPCNMNPVTEKPYARHKWMIKGAPRVKRGSDGETIHFYRVVCARCGINDPKPPLH